MQLNNDNNKQYAVAAPSAGGAGGPQQNKRDSASFVAKKMANPAQNQDVSYIVSAATNYSETFDYVMVFPLKDGVQSDYTKDTVHRMLEAGLEVFTYKSVQEDELLVMIRAPLDLLKRFADKIDYKLRADKVVLQEVLAAGNERKKIKPVIISTNPELTPFSPYEHIYLKYDQEVNQSTYYIPSGEATCFGKSIRLKLIYLLIRAQKRLGGCDIELNKLLHKKRMLAMFPLHDHKYTDYIKERCFDAKVMPWDAPVAEIKDYFGEKIALYNVFLGHYSWWLIIPSIIGLVFQLVVWGTGNFSHPVLPFYSLLITVWSVLMLEYWKRQECFAALRWGMTDFEELEQDRPEFVGDIVKSYINGRDMMYFPPDKAQQLFSISQSIITGFIALVIGVVAAIYVFRFFLQENSDTSAYSSTIASVLNTIQITIFNMIYQYLAKTLTDKENHRTDTQYEDSLIVKMFVFQFINSYASFFFLAFIAGNLPKPDGAPEGALGQCGASNCMEPLSINLAIIFGSRLTVTNVLDILIPYITYRRKLAAETKDSDPSKTLTPAEEDYMLMQYEPMLASIQNYADTAVQYGFTLLFITALPCASFFSLVNNYVKVKVNAWKLITFYQRPIPTGAQDIGTWQVIFNVISIASVITNAGLICFTMDVLWDYTLTGRVWFFIGFQWVLIGIQFLSQVIIDDEPEEVKIQIERMKFIKEKIIDRVADEDFLDKNTSMEQHDVEESGGNSGCCGSKTGKARHRKAQENLPDIPSFNYPDGNHPGSWPVPLNKDSSPQPPKKDENTVTASDLDAYAAKFANPVAAAPAAYH